MAEPKQDQDLPAQDGDAARKGEENRRELDENPAPGTDPLHEGP
jgi:hypothetical protein